MEKEILADVREKDQRKMLRVTAQVSSRKEQQNRVKVIETD